MSLKKKINASILIIGNEILSGRTQDLNVKYLSEWLNNNCGITIEKVVIIPDIKKTIIKNIKELSKTYHYVFTTGGIGPTHDDITAESVAAAFKKKYEFNKQAFSILKRYYGNSGFNSARQKMAKMPRGSKLIYNPSSGAPGFMIKNVLCLPGVPSILQAMLPSTKTFLSKGSKVHTKSFHLVTVESNIARDLDLIQKKFRMHIDIGSYPFFRLGKIGVSVVLRGKNKNKISECSKLIQKMINLKKIEVFSI